MDEPLLTPEQVAEYLVLKPQTVRDAVWRGKIGCVRLWTGRKKSLIRFRRADVEAFVRDRTVGAKSV